MHLAGARRPSTCPPHEAHLPYISRAMDKIGLSAVVATAAKRFIHTEILQTIGGPPLVCYKYGTSLGQQLQNYQFANPTLTPEVIARGDTCPCCIPRFAPFVRADCIANGRAHFVTNEAAEWIRSEILRSVFKLDSKFRPGGAEALSLIHI